MFRPMTPPQTKSSRSAARRRRTRPAGSLLHGWARDGLAAPSLGRFRRAQRRWPVAAGGERGSDELSLFAVQPDGLQMAARRFGRKQADKRRCQRRAGYVLNNGSPSISGFRLADGKLTALPDSTRPLSSADADPAQVLFSTGGRVLIVTERGTNTISSYLIDERGYAQGPATIKSSGQTPYGFGLTADGSLIVSEAFGGATGAAAASSYAVSGAGELTMVSGSSATPAARCAGSR
jgi:3-carboxymuconate cyclase